MNLASIDGISLQRRVRCETDLLDLATAKDHDFGYAKGNFMTGMAECIEIREAEPADARAIAEIHLAARREAMPYLHRAHTDDETRDWFARNVGDRLAAWWVARAEHEVVAYMLIDAENLDHLYVRPGWQRRGVGLSLLNKAKALSPRRLELWTFQRNANGRAFYEAHGFRAVECTDGRNEENEPDVKYEWGPAR